MNVYIEILRPINALMATIAVIIVAIISKNFGFNVILGSLIVFLVTGAGNVINDYFDREIDMINKPNRPIPSGRIKAKIALIYSLALFLIAVFLSFLLRPIITFIVIVAEALLILYAYKLKRKCLIGNVVVSFLTSLTFIFAGIIVNLFLTSFYIAIFAFLMTMAREIVKDIEDIEGDKVMGAKTMPIVYGTEISGKTAAILIILTALLSPVLYLLKIFGNLYILFLSFAIILFLKSAFDIFKKQDKKTARQTSKYLKIGMIITFLAFIAGSIA